MKEIWYPIYRFYGGGHDLGAQLAARPRTRVRGLEAETGKVNDVHHGYLAEASFEGTNVGSQVHQAVCSPLRNALPGEKSRLQNLAWTKPTALAGRLLSRLAGIRAPELTWRLTHDRPWFENHVATLELDGRSAKITFEKAVTDGSGEPGLQRIFARRFA